jgi:hypothetical protein
MLRMSDCLFLCESFKNFLFFSLSDSVPRTLGVAKGLVAGPWHLPTRWILQVLEEVALCVIAKLMFSENFRELQRALEAAADLSVSEVMS